MSGYCPDCGNTQCLCAEIAVDEAKRKAHSLHHMVRQPTPAVASSAWLADMVERLRNAEKHWRKQASARELSYGGQPLYEDGLAEAFGRCADILVNEMAANAPVSDGSEPFAAPLG